MIINGKEYNRSNIGKLFDYAMLNHDVTRADIQNHVKKAIELNVNGVHCNPYWLPMIADMLEGTGIQTGIIPSFPFGCSDTNSKLMQIESDCRILKGRPGCVDAVGNVGLVRGGELKAYTDDLKEIVKVGHEYGYPVKIILETPFLTDDQIADACKCATEAGADYVKTASGRSGVSEMHAVDIMKANISPNMGIKYAGMGPTNVTALVILGLSKGVSLFGNGFAHVVIDEVEKYYSNLVIENK